MSYVVEKSVNSMLHSLVGASVLNPSLDKSKQSANYPCSNISLGLISFVEKLEDAAKISKQEEEDYINKEYQHWLRKVSTQQVKNGTIADILCRGLIAYSRGHRSFNFHIHAIKLSQCDSIYEQKIGSLYLSRTLAPGADLAVLMVNSLQVHLNSGKYHQIACGLCLLPLIANTEITPLLIQLVISSFKSTHAFIRKKAAMMVTVLCNSQYDKDFLYSTFASNLSVLLGDSDPSVAIASILSLSEIFKKSDSLTDNMNIRNDLGKCCTAVMIQAMNKKLPDSYNFQNTVAPMVLVQMLRALNNLAHKSWTPPGEVKETLRLVLSQTISDRSLGQCMSVIEAIHTAAAISTDGELVSLCLAAAMRFIQSTNIDYKYVGIKALTQIFPKVKDLVGQKHVKCVMLCLSNCNPNLEKKSLKLLMAMVGPQNYQDLCIAILEYSMQTKDKVARTEVYVFMSNVTNEFHVDPEWCLKLLPLILKSDIESKALTDSMVQLISKGIILAKDKSPSLWSSCNSLIMSILNSHSDDVKTLIISASLLSAQMRSDSTLVPISMHIHFYKSLEALDDFTLYNKEIIDYIVLSGIYEPSLLSECKSLLKMYLEKVDFLSSFKVKDSLNLLKDPMATKSLFSRQSEILRNTSIDPTLSFADKFINKSHKKSVPYLPSDLLDQTARRNEDQSLLTLTSSSLTSSLPVDNMSFTPVSSVADVSIVGSLKQESPKLVWTKDGRKAMETSYEVTSADVSMSADGDGQSVEIADEAAEEEEVQKSTMEGRKLDLMSKFLKGLKLSD